KLARDYAAIQLIHNKRRMDTDPRHSATSGPPPFWKSPQAIFMALAGLIVAIVGPYMMWRSTGAHGNVRGSGQETSESRPAIDPSLDLSEFDSIPKSLHDGAMLLLT